jgi:hypothetical protein
MATAVKNYLLNPACLEIPASEILKQREENK